LESAADFVASGKADAVAFGKLFIANPDLVRRFRESLPLNAPDAATFYASGAQGYTDYPFYD
ncbi:MAG: alkene reductase, partial [Spirochaetes bacterium]|nr:alkene reductase [Spirochaetota bacterium]